MIQDVDITKNEFTEEELDSLIDILEKAEAVKEDSALFRIVKNRMGAKVKTMSSLSDLKSEYNKKVLEEDKIEEK